MEIYRNKKKNKLCKNLIIITLIKFKMTVLKPIKNKRKKIVKIITLIKLMMEIILINNKIYNNNK